MSTTRTDSCHVESESSRGLLDPEKQVDEIKTDRHHVARWYQEYPRPTIPRPRWSHISLLVRQLGFFLLPSFVQTRLRPDHSPIRRLHPTAWLDGMRGLAAFLVCIDHLSYSCHDTYTAWGATKRGNKEFLKLPLVRFFYTGAFMVAVFFVISGYALSYKPVKLMRTGAWADLQQTFASSVFRRALRLYLPCVASTLIIVVLLRIGLFEFSREIAKNKQWLWFRREIHPHRNDTTSEQLASWVAKLIRFVDPWTFDIREGGAAITLDGHLWTIPVEFRASLVLFLTQLGFSRLRPNWRLLGLACLIFWAHQVDRWEMFLFFAGFFLAELDLARREVEPSQLSSHISNPLRRRIPRRVWTTLYIATFVIALYLGGQPKRRVDTAPGWATLYSLIPSQVVNKQRYWTGWGAVALIWSTSNHTGLQRIFTCRPVQYLGTISFPLYLMHGMVIKTVGFTIMDVMWKTFGHDTWFQRESGFALAGLWSVGITIWTADVFLRAVDTPSVKFAKWVEGRMSRS